MGDGSAPRGDWWHASVLVCPDTEDVADDIERDAALNVRLTVRPAGRTGPERSKLLKPVGDGDTIPQRRSDSGQGAVLAACVGSRCCLSPMCTAGRAIGWHFEQNLSTALFCISSEFLFGSVDPGASLVLLL